MAEERPSLGQACVAVLAAADPGAKVMAARRASREWRLGRIEWRFDSHPPDRPARPYCPELLPPGRMPRRGKAGSQRGRIALLHALAHIEFVAIDLAYDLVARFGAQFPRDFSDDWLRVGADEAMHFAILDRRLRQLGSHYGAMAAHDGLWETAHKTAGDPLSRLALVPMVLEARGLDVTPQTIARFASAGDDVSARILERIYRDEIRHVGCGTRWFEYACAQSNLGPHETWQALVDTHFRGGLKPPFNDSARHAAGLTLSYYAALAQ